MKTIWDLLIDRACDATSKMCVNRVSSYSITRNCYPQPVDAEEVTMLCAVTGGLPSQMINIAERYSFCSYEQIVWQKIGLRATWYA